jgi:hypothetical protein
MEKVRSRANSLKGDRFVVNGIQTGGKFCGGAIAPGTCVWDVRVFFQSIKNVDNVIYDVKLNISVLLPGKTWRISGGCESGN